MHQLINLKESNIDLFTSVLITNYLYSLGFELVFVSMQTIFSYSLMTCK
jgi:hypothetical protein